MTLQEVQMNGVRRVALPGRKELEPRRISESARSQRKSAGRSIRRQPRDNQNAPIGKGPGSGDASSGGGAGAGTLGGGTDMRNDGDPKPGNVERDKQKLF